MRPLEARQISMARSRAQSECGELSTGTKTSLYGMTPPSAVMGSLNGFSELLPTLGGARYGQARNVCQGTRPNYFSLRCANVAHRSQRAISRVSPRFLSRGGDGMSLPLTWLSVISVSLGATFAATASAQGRRSAPVNLPDGPGKEIVQPLRAQ